MHVIFYVMLIFDNFQLLTFIKTFFHSGILSALFC